MGSFSKTDDVRQPLVRSDIFLIIITKVHKSIKFRENLLINQPIKQQASAYWKKWTVFVFFSKYGSVSCITAALFWGEEKVSANAGHSEFENALIFDEDEVSHPKLLKISEKLLLSIRKLIQCDTCWRL